MASLALTRDDIFKEIAYYLGFGRRDYATLLAADAAAAADCLAHLNTGLRRFYFNAIDAKVGRRHAWQFLKPTSSIKLWTSRAVSATETITGVFGTVTTFTRAAGTQVFYESMLGKNIVVTGNGTYPIAGYTSSTVITVAGSHAGVAQTYAITADGNYTLPADFGDILGPMTFGDQTGYPPLTKVGEGQIREFRMEDPDTTGRPQWYAIRPQLQAGVAVVQRFELMVYPLPDSEYTVYYRMAIHPDAPANATDYLYGSNMHSETITEACLAVAEQRSNDETGQHAAEYDRLLQASIAADYDTILPDLLGDMNDEVMADPIRSGRVTVYGVYPE
jgi:hypothetical protein